MPDFKEQGDIVVQPGDVTVPYAFSLPACTTVSSNDGAIPYGSTISTVVVTAHKADGTAATGLVASSSVAANVVTANLTYPSTEEGTYHLRIVATLSTGAKIEFDFNRIQVRNK